MMQLAERARQANKVGWVTVGLLYIVNEFYQPQSECITDTQHFSVHI